MAYDVEISFVGLVTFVRNRPQQGTLTALMPNLAQPGAIRLPNMGEANFLPHLPRLFFQGDHQIVGLSAPTKGYSCQGEEEWSALDITGQHVVIGPQTAPGLKLAGLTLPRVDQLAGSSGVEPETIDPTKWPQHGGVPLLAGRIMTTWGTAETSDWPCRHSFGNDPAAWLAWVVRLKAELEDPVVLTVSPGGSSAEGAGTVTLKPTAGQLKIRFENNCLRSHPGVGCPQGSPDFLAHYNLLQDAANLAVTPTPVEDPACDNPSAGGGDAQCSPAESGG